MRTCSNCSGRMVQYQGFNSRGPSQEYECINSCSTPPTHEWQMAETSGPMLNGCLGDLMALPAQDAYECTNCDKIHSGRELMTRKHASHREKCDPAAVQFPPGPWPYSEELRQKILLSAKAASRSDTNFELVIGEVKDRHGCFVNKGKVGLFGAFYADGLVNYLDAWPIPTQSAQDQTSGVVSTMQASSQLQRIRQSLLPGQRAVIDDQQQPNQAPGPCKIRWYSNRPPETDLSPSLGKPKKPPVWAREYLGQWK